MAKPSIDLTGQRFGRLVVVGVKGRSPYGRFLWECVCDCGNKHLAVSITLKNGHTRSCGCLLKETSSANTRTHGMSGSPVHRTWLSMLQRCSNESLPGYVYYGGRGIKVCDRWKQFENFYADMGDRPDGMTIDRINYDGDYSPENCRWATIETQANNKRSNRLIEHDGRTMTLAEWSRELGKCKQTLWARLKKYGTFGPDRDMRRKYVS